MQPEAPKTVPAPGPALKYVPEGGGEYVITHPRFLSGHMDEETGKFIYVDGHDPSYVPASVDFPQVVVLPEGHKLDRSYKALNSPRPVVPELRKPYNDGKVHPQGKLPAAPEAPAADASKKAKRPSDTQAI